MRILKASSLGESFEKWLQAVTVFIYMNILITWFVAGKAILLFVAYYFPATRYPLLLYIGWMYYDRKSPKLGERRSRWLQGLKFWKYHNEYFPAKLHKTADLPPDKNYLICGFPHGVLCTGSFSAFGNDYGGFQKLFPGLSCYMMTLEQHFSYPLFREYCMFMGALPSSAECLNYFLGTKKNIAMVLMVGGAQESFYSNPGVYQVNLKKRKGFIKIAYKNGTSLVPSISFGEPDIYQQIQFAENSLMKKLQMVFKRITGVAPLIFHGQFGLLPYKKPLNVVVGNPIPVEKIEEPTQEQIDSLHAKFIDALSSLFEKEKYKYLENAEKTHMTIT
ncbi:hypothetical protein RUM43_002183 [Polyplax serrata]|uniref:Acyltransferase n=1 Tax=Polyplax serrata TaxID=468196 RepID=A0AAN8S958_POLSC